MAKKVDLGTKRVCPECEAKFYDLAKVSDLRDRDSLGSVPSRTYLAVFTAPA